MSDYCYLEIAFRNEDQKLLSECLAFGGGDFWDDIVDGGDDWAKVSVHQANYGWRSELEKAASKGIVFYGFHGEGGDYPSVLFVCFGGKLLECYEINRWPAVRLDDSLAPMAQDMKDAKEYDALLTLAVTYIQESQCPPK